MTRSRAKRQAPNYYNFLHQLRFELLTASMRAAPKCPKSVHITGPMDLNRRDSSVFCSFFQHNIMVNRRRDGVKPDMPTAEERQEILAAIGGKPY